MATAEITQQSLLQLYHMLGLMLLTCGYKAQGLNQILTPVLAGLEFSHFGKYG